MLPGLKAGLKLRSRLPSAFNRARPFRGTPWTIVKWPPNNTRPSCASFTTVTTSFAPSPTPNPTSREPGAGGMTESRAPPLVTVVASLRTRTA